MCIVMVKYEGDIATIGVYSLDYFFSLETHYYAHIIHVVKHSHIPHNQRLAGHIH